MRPSQVRWSSSELALCQGIEQALLQRNEHVLLVAPIDAPLRKFLDLIFVNLTERWGLARSTFRWYEESEGAVPSLCDLISMRANATVPVNAPTDLARIYPETVPPVTLLILMKGSNSPASFRSTLELWGEYLKCFRTETQNGRGIRLVCALHATPGIGHWVGELPEGFRRQLWREWGDDELLIASDSITKEFVGLSSVEESFLRLKLLDMSGGRRQDLQLAGELAQRLRVAQPGTWLADLDWSSAPDCIAQWASERWGQVCHHANSIRHLLTVGGFLPEHDADMFEADNLDVIDDLWAAGLWAGVKGTRYAGSLTPLALTSLGTGLAHNNSWPTPPQPFDRVAGEMLSRCLALERLLRYRFRQRVLQPNGATQLNNVLNQTFPPGHNQTLRKELQNNVPVPFKNARDTELVERASLRPFLKVFRAMFGLTPTGREDRIASIRNNLAHVQKAKWEEYQELVSLEPLVAQLGLP